MDERKDGTMAQVPDGYYAVRYNEMVGFYRFRTSSGGRCPQRNLVKKKSLTAVEGNLRVYLQARGTA